MRILTFLIALTFPVVLSAAEDALDEVNAARAARGLPAFVRDDDLTKAAMAAADYRAARRLAGHSANDFAFLPEGARADAAGCGALEPSWGWGSCCTYDGYSHAGAALVMGADGRRYMHLFVAGRTASSGATTIQARPNQPVSRGFGLFQRRR